MAAIILHRPLSTLYDIARVGLSSKSYFRLIPAILANYGPQPEVLRMQPTKYQQIRVLALVYLSPHCQAMLQLKLCNRLV